MEGGKEERRERGREGGRDHYHSVREHRRRQSQKYHAALGHLLTVPV